MRIELGDWSVYGWEVGDKVLVFQRKDKEIITYNHGMLFPEEIEEGLKSGELIWVKDGVIVEVKGENFTVEV